MTSEFQLFKDLQHCFIGFQHSEIDDDNQDTSTRRTAVEEVDDGMVEMKAEDEIIFVGTTFGEDFEETFDAVYKEVFNEWHSTNNTAHIDSVKVVKETWIPAAANVDKTNSSDTDNSERKLRGGEKSNTKKRKGGPKEVFSALSGGDENAPKDILIVGAEISGSCRGASCNYIPGRAVGPTGGGRRQLQWKPVQAYEGLPFETAYFLVSASSSYARYIVC